MSVYSSNPKFRSLGIVLVLVVVLVLGASTFCAGKDYRLSCNYFVPLVWLSNIRILEDEDDDEHEHDSSTSEFRFNGKAALSGDMALRIEKAFGVKMDMLMRKQSPAALGQRLSPDARVGAIGTFAVLT